MEILAVADNDPTVNIEQPPEPRHKGRKPGAVARHNKSAVIRLAELGFDPLEKLVQLYGEITTEINELNELKTNPKVLKNGDIRRYSSMAHAQLITTQQKLINDLMRYGYARVPETVNIKPEAPKGITINLTPVGGKFNADDVVDVLPVEEEEEEDD
jgi:hypothetical protein